MGPGPFWIEKRKLENPKKLKSLMIFLFSAIKYCQKTALYTSPATTCTKFSVNVEDWFPKKWMGVGGCCELYPIFLGMSGIVITLQGSLRIVLFSFVLHFIFYVL